MLTILAFAAGLFWAALSAAMLAGLPPIWALFTATAGNALGSMTTYGLGGLGRLDWLQQYCRMTGEQINRAQKRVRQFGSYAAFLYFVPVIGDLFCGGAGADALPPWPLCRSHDARQTDALSRLDRDPRLYYRKKSLIFLR